MNNFFRKYGLVIGLTVSAIVMGTVKLQYKNYNWPSKDQTVNIVTPTPTVTPTKVIDPDYPLWQELPYEGEGFVVDRYLDKLTVVVIPKGLDRKIIEREVWNWFEEKKVATEEMEIVWE